MKKTLITLLSVAVLTGCSNKAFQSQTDTSTATSQSSTVQVADKAEETTKTEMSELSYEEYTSILNKITLSELQEKLNSGEKVFVYFGRETCEYCNIFVPKLYDVLKATKDITVYYVDTEDRLDEELIAFRDKYEIKTVPNFSYFEGEEKVDTLVNGSQSTEEEIKEILGLN